MLNTRHALRRTDWAMLAVQKQVLLAHINSTNQDVHALMGIVNFLDAIQDAACADGIALPYQVFPNPPTPTEE